MPPIQERALNIADLRDLARRRLPRLVYEFVQRGAEDDVAIRNNRAAFERWSLRPQVLRDVSQRSVAIDLFGKSIAMPVVMGPTGAAALVWHDGELALGKAAAAANVPFTISTLSLTSVERVAREAGGRLWFQIYMWPDRSMSHELVKRAQNAGCEALVVTVDTPVGVNREYNTRNGFVLPFRVSRRNFIDLALHGRWLSSVILRYKLTTGLPRFENYPESLQRSMLAAPKGRSALPKTDSLTWDDLRQLRKVWSGPLLVKGLLHPDDAHAAAVHGADGIVVSNHGGRNLDTSIAPLDALPDIVDRVAGRIDVLVDGGVMRGSDVVKALALGAKAVMVGRAPLWGVAAAGQAGAGHALAILREETTRVLAQVGCSNVAQLGPHLLWRALDAGPHGSQPAAARPRSVA